MLLSAFLSSACGLSVTVYFVTRPIDSRSCLLSLLLSSRNLDIDLNQQALVQLSPPPLPKLNQIQLWVILQPELGLTCHTNPPPLPMPSHLMLFYDQPPPFPLKRVLIFPSFVGQATFLPRWTERPATDTWLALAFSSQLLLSRRGWSPFLATKRS